MSAIGITILLVACPSEDGPPGISYAITALANSSKEFRPNPDSQGFLNSGDCGRGGRDSCHIVPIASRLSVHNFEGTALVSLLPKIANVHEGLHGRHGHLECL